MSKKNGLSKRKDKKYENFLKARGNKNGHSDVNSKIPKQIPSAAYLKSR